MASVGTTDNQSTRMIRGGLCRRTAGTTIVAYGFCRPPLDTPAFSMLPFEIRQAECDVVTLSYCPGGGLTDINKNKTRAGRTIANSRQGQWKLLACGTGGIRRWPAPDRSYACADSRKILIKDKAMHRGVACSVVDRSIEPLGRSPVFRCRKVEDPIERSLIGIKGVRPFGTKQASRKSRISSKVKRLKSFRRRGCFHSRTIGVLIRKTMSMPLFSNRKAVRSVAQQRHRS